MNTQSSLILWAQSTLPSTTNWPSSDPSSTPPPYATAEQLKIIEQTQISDKEKLDQLGLKIRVVAEAAEAIIRFSNILKQYTIEIKNNSSNPPYNKCLLCNQIKLNSFAYKIKNRKTDLSVTVCDLGLHYMKCHDFCGFPETSTRTDVDNLVCVLYAKGCQNKKSRKPKFHYKGEKKHSEKSEIPQEK